MTDGLEKDIEAARRTIATTIRAHWKLFLAQGVVMMGLGLAAAGLPQFATVAIEIFVGWLFFVGGIFRTLTVLRLRNAPGFGWSLTAALLAIVIGLILVTRPYEGVLTLTAVLAALFVIEGGASFLIALDYRRHLPAWRWILFSGIVNLVLAFLIWRGWPGSTAWAIGLLVGIGMFFLGLSLTATALSARALNSDDGSD